MQATEPTTTFQSLQHLLALSSHINKPQKEKPTHKKTCSVFTTGFQIVKYT